ncbi:uncharacterized protein LOC144866381 [Branchiostoma floridae x Branchiostoma japonicum]
MEQERADVQRISMDLTSQNQQLRERVAAMQETEWRHKTQIDEMKREREERRRYQMSQQQNDNLEMSRQVHVLQETQRAMERQHREQIRKIQELEAGQRFQQSQSAERERRLEEDKEQLQETLERERAETCRLRERKSLRERCCCC